VRPPRSLNPRLDAQDHTFSRLAATSDTCYAFGTEASIKMGSHALTRMPPVGELQQDGHLTVTELAGRVDVSLSPCHRRLRASEKSGGR
jgi:Winged helix-turn-helix DNA-binding